MPPSITTITLHPALPHDIPSLSLLAGASFATDRQTILKTLVSGYDHAEGMKGALEHWIGIASAARARGELSRVEVMKAVEGQGSDGEALGWVAWGSSGLVPQTSVPAPVVEPAPVEAEAEPEAEATKQAAEAPSEETTAIEAEPEHQDSPIARLEALTDADMDDFMSDIMPSGTKCLYIMSIVVSPSHQGRGVGRALIQYGTQRVNREGVFAWVHASEAGAGMFEKQGFEEVRQLRVDLDTFCGGRGVDEVEGLERKGVASTGWGEYVFRYMVRKPKDA